MVMLDSKDLYAALSRQGLRNAGGKIIRMQVTGDGLRFKFK